MGCGWRAHTWVPTNYMIYHGLRAYGYLELASLVARYTHDPAQSIGNCEYYDAESGVSCGLDPL